MQRRIAANNRTALLLERLVWNAAAGAVLAVMILILLGSLRWLDHVAPREARGGGLGGEPPAVSAEPALRTPPAPGGSAIAGVDGPSG